MSKTINQKFRNRIISYGDEPVDQIMFNPNNWRIHPKAQQEALTGVLEEIGWVQNVIINKHTGHLVDGHLRVQLADRAGERTVPVTYVDLSEAEEIAVLATIDPIAQLAATDKEKLDAVLHDIHVDDARIQQMLAELAKLEGLYQIPESKDAEPRLDQAEELRDKWGVETGQLWQLEGHRLLCGDSTKPDDVARVLKGEKPLLMVTDPPYGVEYDPAWRERAGLSTHTGKMGKVVNDDIVDWSAAWRLFEGDVACIWHAGRHASEVQKSLESVGFEIRCQIIWAKDRFALSRGHYHWQHEPCWYAFRKGSNGHWIGDHKQNTLWTIPAREDSGHGHGTQKPLECMARPIRNHSSDYVYEPFSGSGTTIIACENLGRKCRAIEISPPYVAVALQRWADTTGKTPEKID